MFTFKCILTYTLLLCAKCLFFSCNFHLYGFYTVMHGSASLCRDGQKTKWWLPWKYYSVQTPIFHLVVNSTRLKTLRSAVCMALAQTLHNTKSVQKCA